MDLSGLWRRWILNCMLAQRWAHVLEEVLPDAPIQQQGPDAYAPLVTAVRLVPVEHGLDDVVDLLVRQEFRHLRPVYRMPPVLPAHTHDPSRRFRLPGFRWATADTVAAVQALLRVVDGFAGIRMALDRAFEAGVGAEAAPDEPPDTAISRARTK